MASYRLSYAGGRFRRLQNSDGSDVNQLQLLTQKFIRFAELTGYPFPPGTNEENILERLTVLEAQLEEANRYQEATLDDGTEVVDTVETDYMLSNTRRRALARRLNRPFRKLSDSQNRALGRPTDKRCKYVAENW